MLLRSPVRCLLAVLWVFTIIITSFARAGSSPHHHLPPHDDELNDGSANPDESTSSSSSSLFSAWFLLMGSRSLVAATKDWERFNILLEGAEMAVPDSESSQRVMLIDFVVSLTDTRCQGLQLDDMNATVSHYDDASVTFDLFVQADLTCFASYHYKYGIFRGSGQVDVYTANSRLSVSIKVASDSTLDAEPPSYAAVTQCWAEVDVTHMDFHGGMVAGMADLFQGSISKSVERAVDNEACKNIVEKAPALVTSGMGRIQAQLDKVLQPLPSDRYDPLFPEQQLLQARNATSPILVNFQQPGGMGGTFRTALAEVDRFLAKKVRSEDDGGGGGSPDNTFAAEALAAIPPMAWDEEGGDDLAANAWLRNHVLDPDRCWRGSLAAMVAPNGTADAQPASVKLSDSLTETTLTLESVQLCGLDTLQTILVARPVGQHTFRNEFSWRYLTLVLDVTVDMKPSTSNDSVWIDPGPGHVVERIQVTLGAEQVAVNLTTLLALDQEAVLDLELGSLLRSENLAPCFLSVLRKAGVSGLEATVGSLIEPTLTGFVSPGLDRMVSSLTSIAFLAYEPTLIRALSGALQGPTRVALDHNVLDRFAADSDPGTVSCPVVRLDNASAQANLDFRDLLLPPETSRSLGGSGRQPYGDVGSMSYTAVMERMNEIESDRLPAINEALIRPLTRAQSGEAGIVRCSDSALSFRLGNYTLNFTEVQIRNVDSVASNFTLLEPTYDPTLLENTATWGATSERELSVSIRMVAASAISDLQSLRLFNDLEIQVMASDVDVLAGIAAKLQTGFALSMPLRYVLDLDCWMSTLAVENDPSLELLAFLLRLSSLRISATCNSCSSPGTVVLPQVFQILQDVGAFKVLGDRLEAFLTAFVVGDTVKGFLAEKVDEARSFCPRSPLYNSTAVRSNSTIGLPLLSGDDIDALLFFASTTSAVISVVVAEGHVHNQSLASEDRPHDFLNESSFLDWTDLPGSLGTLGAVIDEASIALRSFAGSVDSRGKLNINSVLNNMILDNKYLSLDPGARLRIGDLSVSFDEIRVAGLDTFTRFEVFKPTSSRTLRSEFLLESIAMSVGVLVENESSNFSSSLITLDIDASNVSLVVDVDVAVDSQMLGSIAIGSLFNTSNIFPCLVSTIRGLSLLSIEAKAESYGVPRFGGLKDDTSFTLNSTIDRLHEQFGSVFVRAIPNIFNTTLRGMINVGVQDFLAYKASRQCSSPIRRSISHKYMDFRDLFLRGDEAKRLGGSGAVPYGDLFRRIYSAFNEFVLKTDAKSGLATVLNSAVVSKLTKQQSGKVGSVVFVGDLVKFSSSLRVGGLDATAALEISDVSLENLDTIGSPLSLLKPVSVPYMLNSTASLGVGPPVRAAARLLFGLSSNESEIWNEVTISVDVTHLSLTLNALLLMLESEVADFPTRDAFNGHCWLATMPPPHLDIRGVRLKDAERSFSIVTLAPAVKKVALNVTCISCSSPGISNLSDWLSTANATTKITSATNEFFNYASELLGGKYLEVAADRMLNQAPYRCPHSADYDSKYLPFDFDEKQGQKTNGSTTSVFMVLAIVLVASALAVASVAFVIGCLVRRRHRKWLTAQPPEKVAWLWRQQTKANAVEKQVNSTTTSMFQSPAVPRWIRLLMPLVIVGNTAFFISGHFSLGATVVIEATVADDDFTVSKFFEFSMGRSIIEIWNAGGKALAILVLIFSGIWPYAKQATTLALWFLPPSAVSVERRGSILLWMDTLAKWSIVDIFVLIVTIAGFRVSVRSPGGVLPDNFYRVNLLVVPMWGLYSNMIAQLLSQVSSHVIVHCHRSIVKEASSKISSASKYHGVRSGRGGFSRSVALQRGQSDDNSTTRLCEHGYTRPHRGESDALLARAHINPALIITSMCSGILLVLGCLLPSFSVKLLGLVGVLVESGQGFQDATTEYSLFGVVKMLLDQAAMTSKVSDFVGLGSLSLLMVASVLLVPMAQSICLAVQWLCALSPRRRRRVSLWIEVLASWQYAEVYLLALFIASWQLGTVSDFMINGYCEALAGTLAKLVYYGVLADEDAQCFRAESSIEPAAYVLLTAAALLALINTFVMNAEAQHRRDLDAKRDFQSSNVSIDRSLPDDDEILLMQRSLKPPPVLFTDKFRWLLVREDLVRYSTSTSMSGWRPRRPILPSASGGSAHGTPGRRRPYLSFVDPDCEHLGRQGLNAAPSVDQESWRDGDDPSSSLSSDDDSSGEPLSSEATSSRVGYPHNDSSVYTSDTSHRAARSIPALAPGCRRQQQVSFDDDDGSSEASSIHFAAEDGWSSTSSSRVI